MPGRYPRRAPGRSARVQRSADERIKRHRRDYHRQHGSGIADRPAPPQHETSDDKAGQQAPSERKGADKDEEYHRHKLGRSPAPPAPVGQAPSMPAAIAKLAQMQKTERQAWNCFVQTKFRNAPARTSRGERSADRRAGSRAANGRQQAPEAKAAGPSNRQKRQQHRQQGTRGKIEVIDAEDVERKNRPVFIVMEGEGFDQSGKPVKPVQK